MELSGDLGEDWRSFIEDSENIVYLVYLVVHDQHHQDWEGTLFEDMTMFEALGGKHHVGMRLG